MFLALADRLSDVAFKMRRPIQIIYLCLRHAQARRLDTSAVERCLPFNPSTLQCCNSFRVI